MQGTKEPEQWGLIPRSLAKILHDAEARYPYPYPYP